MKRILFFTAAAVLVAAPAVAGLVGNSSLSPSVPVVPPTQAVVSDDHGGLTDRDDRTEVGDDRAVQGGVAIPSATPSPTSTPEVGDDHGGLTDRDDRFEPGDDRDVNGGATSSADDSGHHGDSSGSDDGSSGGGSDDGPGHDVGDDHGGHGSDD
jgi:hypothetical protein